MPRTTEQAKEARREQILAGARRCFARDGYEGATVAKLEAEIGLSRGAIFNYFPSKDDILIELCRRDNQRISRIFINEGLEAVVTEILEEDPAWFAVYLEIARRLRTDPEFESRVGADNDDLSRANRARFEEAQRTGEFRDDFEARDLGRFLNLVLNGIAVQRAAGEETPGADVILRLLRDAVGGRGRTRPRRSA